MSDNEIDLKEEVRMILRYYDQRLDHCTMGELKATAGMFAEHLDLMGTADDFAQFFGKSKDAVFGIIKRNVTEKPKRNVVLYSFKAFLKKVPKSWTRK